MTDGNGTTVDIELLHGDAQFLLAVDHLHRKGLVQLPQADIIHGEAKALQQRWHGKDRTNTHLIGLTASHHDAAHDTQRGNVLFLGHIAAHDHAGRSTIGQLGGVAGGDESLGTHHGVQLFQSIQRGLWPVALVLVQCHFLLGHLARFPVLDLHHGGERHDLVLEATGLLGCRGALLAQQRIFVLTLPADSIPLGHHLGGLDHGQPHLWLVLHQPVLGVMMDVDIVLHQADGLEAARHHHRHLVHDHAVRRHDDGLHAGGTEAVDGGAAGGHWQLGAQCRKPGNVATCGPFGQPATEDHIFHLTWLDTGALHSLTNHMATHGSAVGQVEGTAKGLANTGAGCGHNHCFDHLSLFLHESTVLNLKSQ